jgi:hypothetical protein
MLVSRNSYGYTNKKKYVTGRGFIDSISNVFKQLGNAFKVSAVPAFKNIGSYVLENKDLIAKPVLGAIGSLAATGLSAGVPAILKHIASRNRKKAPQTVPPESDMNIPEDVKYREILNNIMANNVTGGGIKLF